MARDPKEWASGIGFYDITLSGEELNIDEIADLIREAQADGAVDVEHRAASLAAEVATLRERLSDIASTAQGAFNAGEWTQGLEAIFHMAIAPVEVKVAAPAKDDDDGDLPF